MAECRIFILFQYFMYILTKFNTFSRSCKPISQFNTINTVWEPYNHLGNFTFVKILERTLVIAIIYQRCNRRKWSSILGLITEKLNVSTFIIPGPITYMDRVRWTSCTPSRRSWSQQESNGPFSVITMKCCCRCYQGCGVRVTMSRMFFGRVQLNYFLHRTRKAGILSRACWNGTISFETFIETDTVTVAVHNDIHWLLVVTNC